MSDCLYRSPWRDSGDRGADMSDHARSYHPGHEHVWGPSTYEWEAAGAPTMVNGERTTRTETATRCTVCALAPSDDQTGRCAEHHGPKS